MTALLAHYDSVLMSNAPMTTQTIIAIVAQRYSVSYGVAAELILLSYRFGLPISEFTAKD